MREIHVQNHSHPFLIYIGYNTKMKIDNNTVSTVILKHQEDQLYDTE